MLSLVMIEKIEWLLRSADLSQRQVAMRLGVSRGSVAAIARGKRSAKQQRSASALQIASKDQHAPQIVPDFDAVPVRCPSCGCRVYLPCLVCHLRKMERDRRAIRRLGCGQNVSRRVPSESSRIVPPDQSDRGVTVSNRRMGAGSVGKSL